MNLKASQIHCTAVYNTLRLNFTTHTYLIGQSSAFAKPRCAAVQQKKQGLWILSPITFKIALRRDLLTASLDWSINQYAFNVHMSI